MSRRPVAAAAVAVAVLGGGALTACGGGSNQPQSVVTETVTGSHAASPSTHAASPSKTAPRPKGAYPDGLKVSVSGFHHAVSSDSGSPANTGYEEFTVTLKNGSSKTLDTTLANVSCAADGKAADPVFDDSVGSTGNTHLLPGNTYSFKWGCAVHTGTAALQVEVTPDFDHPATVFVEHLNG